MTSPSMQGGGERTVASGVDEPIYVSTGRIGLAGLMRHFAAAFAALSAMTWMPYYPIWSLT